MEDDREASSSAPPGGGGVKPWVFVLLLSAFIVIFLPTIFSSSRGFRPAGVKGGWDSVNFVLVIFAILCGVLGRRRTEDDADRSPLASPTSNAWLVDAGGGYGASPTARSGYLDAAEGDRGSGIRRMRSSSSYPDLRQEATATWGGSGDVGEGFRFYDDIQLYKRRPEQLPWESRSFRSPETKTIPVDTFVLKGSSSLSPRSRSPPPVPSQQQQLRRRNIPKVSENLPEKDAIVQPEKFYPPAPPSAEGPPQLEGHRRGRSLENFPSMEAKQGSSFAPEKQSPSLLETAPASSRHRRRRSLETLPENFAPEKTNLSALAPPSQHRRRRSVDDLWGWDAEKTVTFEAEQPRTPVPAPSVPSPPPPPPPFRLEEKRNNKKRSGGGTKDIASALASFYQKKMKGNKKNRAHDDISLHLNTTTTSTSRAPPTPPPPPPPPPLPSSVFHQLFSKKGGSKSQRIHSLSTSTMAAPHPPPPPPPPPSRYSRFQGEVVTPPSSSPPPPPPRRSNRQIPQPPPLPPPSPPRSRITRKKEKIDFSRFSAAPLSPLRPPPPPPPFPESDEVESVNGGGNGDEVNAGQSEATPGVTVFCPSPDVNNKADLFIARFREGLKLEKLNSLREKERQKEQQQTPEEEFMMVGGLFDDDDPVPN